MNCRSFNFPCRYGAHNTILYSALLELVLSILLLLDHCRRDVKCTAEGEIEKERDSEKEQKHVSLSGFVIKK